MWCQLSAAMKNWPPCCGLWSPWASDFCTRTAAEPSPHLPGSVSSLSEPGHFQATDTVISPSVREQIGHLPGSRSATTA